MSVCHCSVGSEEWKAPDGPTAPSSLGRSPAPTGHRFAWALAVVLVLAAGWRLTLASLMPCISRDGVSWCWLARDLGREGPAVLRRAETQQHPLFPLALLTCQRAARALGWPDTPLTWQRAGQAVAWSAGLAVVALSAALTATIARRLPAPVHPARAAILAALLAALLPLNTWNSADVMSDELHLAWYLAAAALLVRLLQPGASRPTPAGEPAQHRAPSSAPRSGAALRVLSAPAALALGVGALSGLAFLTRPEGAAIAVAAIGLLLVAPRSPSPSGPSSDRAPGGHPLGSSVLATGAVLLGFLLCAGPYWALSGKLSPKLDKETIDRFLPRDQGPSAVPGTPALYAARPPVHAALVRREVSWIALAPAVLYELFRAGRVVVPLLAAATLVALRGYLRHPALRAALACLGIHLLLAAALLKRHGYLDPRHLLPAAGMLIPLAALALDGLWHALAGRGRTLAAAGACGLCLLPLALYSLRVPNHADGFLARAAADLRQRDPLIAGHLLLGGSSEKRLAFYADLRYQPWPENEPDAPVRLTRLREHLLSHRPRYLALETGPTAALAANRALLDGLFGTEPAGSITPSADAVRTRVRGAHRYHGPRGRVLHVYELDWSDAGQAGG